VIDAHRCAFVLWGEQCDEAATARFVTSLRAAGVRVWVVGISGKRNSGTYGLRLLTDLALDQALPLAQQAAVVIMPCARDRWLTFRNDPRLLAFLAECVAHQAMILLAPPAGGHPLALPPTAQVEVYPTGTALFAFVQRLATRLRTGSPPRFETYPATS